MSRNPDWYALNCTRPYPIDDGASCVDDEGRFLPTDIIADLCLSWPVELGRHAYLSAISITDKVVTLVILAATDLVSATCVPLATINLVRPFDKFRLQTLMPLQDAVAGWVVFGDGIDNEIPYTARFTLPSQSYFTRRSAKSFRTPTISGVRVFYGPAPCYGLVSLVAGSDMEIVSGCREFFYDAGTLNSQIEGGGCELDPDNPEARGYQVAVLQLKDTGQQADRNVLQIYQPSCNKAPESGECDLPPIEFLGPVAPDCDGNITIEFMDDSIALGRIVQGIYRKKASASASPCVA
jgi:hypothetical protein